MITTESGQKNVSPAFPHQGCEGQIAPGGAVHWIRQAGKFWNLLQPQGESLHFLAYFEGLDPATLLNKMDKLAFIACLRLLVHAGHGPEILGWLTVGLQDSISR
jgi:hypothetical protein